MLRARTVTVAALYTGLVAVSTLIFSIYVPATRGYFNIGEAAVYLVALLAGPYIGAFAGGVGSMLADLMLGYFFFAPATLIIKGAEGGIAGLLAGRRPALTLGTWRALSALLAVAVASTIFLIGTYYYVGESTVSVGLPGAGSQEITFSMSWAMWAAISLVAGSLIVALSLTASPSAGWNVLSAAVSGSVMIAGYYLYEQFVLGFAAIAEVPFNITQVLVGIAIAIPAYSSLRSLGFRSKSEYK